MQALSDKSTRRKSLGGGSGVGGAGAAGGAAGYRPVAYRTEGAFQRPFSESLLAPSICVGAFGGADDELRLGVRLACLVNASVTVCGDDSIYAFGGFDQYTDEGALCVCVCVYVCVFVADGGG